LFWQEKSHVDIAQSALNLACNKRRIPDFDVEQAPAAPSVAPNV
jgi:hypothetical protein